MIGENQDFDLSKYRKLNSIGQGGFGKVFKIEEKETGEIYAEKISHFPFNIDSKDEILNLSREVNLNAGMNHPAVLKFIGYTKIDINDQQYPVIITEYAKNGSLAKLLTEERRGLVTKYWTDTKKLINIYGIASGMKYLHSNNILHRDLKPGNILLDAMLLPKIGDFGLSKQTHSNQYSITLQSENIIKGTQYYIAPEVYNEKVFTKANDVYAFGLIVYEILTGEIPYKDLDYQFYQKVIKEGYRPHFKIPIEKCYQELIERCWSQDPKDRPTFDEIVRILETDVDFHTLDDIDDFFDYVNFINHCSSSFNKVQIIKIEDFIRNPESKMFQRIDIYKYIEEEENKSLFSKIISRIFKKDKIYPIDEFKKLNEKCQQQVIEADNNSEKQYLIGTCLINGSNNFPLNVELGVKYLERSINDNFIISAIYLSKMLLEGTKIPHDTKKAKRILSKFFKTKDPNIYFLYGKILMNEKNYKEVRKFFEKYAKEGDLYSMYKYGKLCFCGIGGLEGINEAKYYFNLSKNKGFIKSKLYLMALEKMNNNMFFMYLPTIIQNFFIMQIVRYIKSSSKNRIDDRYLFKKMEIHMRSKDTQLIFTDYYYCCFSPEFLKILKQFANIIIELSFPLKSFNNILSRVSYLKTSFPKINICVYITSFINETLSNSDINQVIIDSSIQKIPIYAFNGCKQLTNITIHNFITSIEKNAFCGCISLTKISIPSSITVIKKDTFRKCTSLKEISIPSSIKLIESRAFYKCSSLQEILIPDCITSIEDQLFYRCSSLTQIVIPSSVTSIGKYAFGNCISLMKITMSFPLSLIDDGAFYKCTSIKQISLPMSLIRIGKSAFNGCTSLTQIEIPNGVTSIEDFTFNGCSSLTKIIIPISVLSIGESAFNGCSLLKQISIPKFVTSIGKLAFNKCTELKEISFPKSIIKIGESTFNECTSLNQIIIPKSINLIPDDVFCKCSSLKYFFIPSSITKICNNAFYGCASLVRIAIPQSVISIEKYAFSRCTSLQNITFSSSIVSIKESAFNECSSLKEISIPFSVTSIEKNLFYKCTSLEKVTIPSSIVSIGKNAFFKCISLIQISLPFSLISIEDNAFNGCKLLSNIKIPVSTNKIGKCAFKDCISLVKISIPLSVKSIGENAFNRCSSLRQIYIPFHLSFVNIGIDSNSVKVKFLK